MCAKKLALSASKVVDKTRKHSGDNEAALFAEHAKMHSTRGRNQEPKLEAFRVVCGSVHASQSLYRAAALSLHAAQPAALDGPLAQIAIARMPWFCRIVARRYNTSNLTATVKRHSLIW
jgi:hypothetical protein